MTLTLTLVLSLILFMLSILHFNWALGGKWGFDKVIPTNPEGERVFHPKKKHSLIVGLCLLIFALFYLLKSELIPLKTPISSPYFAGWIISVLFILRAIGDFNYIGFFKKITQTKYANLDTMIYTPMCSIIGFLGIVLELISK